MAAAMAMEMFLVRVVSAAAMLLLEAKNGIGESERGDGAAVALLRRQMARRIYHRKSRDEGRKRRRFRRPKESWTAGERGLPAVRLGGGLRVEYGTTAG